MIVHIKKRDDRLVSFNANKIVDAIEKAMLATDNGMRVDAQKIADEVILDSTFKCNSV